MPYISTTIHCLVSVLQYYCSLLSSIPLISTTVHCFTSVLQYSTFYQHYSTPSCISTIVLQCSSLYQYYRTTVLCLASVLQYYSTNVSVSRFLVQRFCDKSVSCSRISSVNRLHSPVRLETCHVPN